MTVDALSPPAHARPLHHIHIIVCETSQTCVRRAPIMCKTIPWCEYHDKFLCLGKLCARQYCSEAVFNMVFSPRPRLTFSRGVSIMLFGTATLQYFRAQTFRRQRNLLLPCYQHGRHVQGFLAHKKRPPPWDLHRALGIGLSRTSIGP